MKLLRQCTLPEVKQDKSEVQQIKSLSLVVKDLKLNRNQTQVSQCVEKTVSSVYTKDFEISC